MTSASAEIARRRAVRSSMIEWARLNNFEPALHHRLLCTKLEAVARGEIRKLIFILPPGRQVYLLQPVGPLVHVAVTRQGGARRFAHERFCGTFLASHPRHGAGARHHSRNQSQ